MLSTPALYIHYPWCVKKCPYCDFNSHPLNAQTDYTAYTDALLADLRAQLRTCDDNIRFHSVFLGGGTPSLCPPAEIERVLRAVPLSDDAEVTMEANPGTTEHADFAAFRAAGINRLSIGAQSFDADALLALGRIHGPDEISRAFAQARAGGFANINIDLMWGLPQQSVAQARTDLEQAIALEPEHLSWYQLTIEPKTEFARRPPQLPLEDCLADIEATGSSVLTSAGYTRYEVSAWARPGQQCAHNLNYWRFGDYLGVGAGAHGKRSTTVARHANVLRTAKPRQPRLYLGGPTQTPDSPVDADALPGEFMMNALRLVDGVDFDVFEATTGLGWDHVASVWTRLTEQGLVRADRCATTPLGLRFLDAVVAEFIA